MNRSRLSISPQGSVKGSPQKTKKQPLRVPKGHKPMTTSRDKDIFSQISGISTTVRNFAMRTVEGFSKRGSTSDPLGQEDSLFMGHLIG